MIWKVRGLARLGRAAARAPIISSTAAPVLDKYITRSRSSTTYHLQVPPFAGRRAPSTVTVPYAAYAALSPGDRVCIAEHRGAIGLPWVSARLCGG